MGKEGRPPRRFGQQFAKSFVSLLGLRGVPLLRPPLVFFAFVFTTVTQSNRKGPGSSHWSSGGPMARWSPLLYSLYRTLLQVQGKTQPWRERKEKAAPGLPVAFALLSSASYTVPPLPQDCRFPKTGSWTGTPVSSPQETPQIYLHRNHYHTPTWIYKPHTTAPHKHT